MRNVEEIAAAIVAPPKGMLVADEYAEALVPDVAEVVLRTTELSEHVSAILLTAKTFTATLGLRESLAETPLVGVRMDPSGSGLPGRVAAAAAEGAAFVEWRANRSPPNVPRGSVHIESEKLAVGAAMTQTAGLLPVLTIAMPDLGPSSIAVNQAVTTNALLALRDQLEDTGVDARRLLVRVNMVVTGQSHPSPAEPDQVARRTVQLLERCLPAGTPGVLLLSGGQSPDQACANLGAVSALAATRDAPWRVTFGFSRALVAGVVGVPEDTARRALVQNARRASGSMAPALVGQKPGS